MSYFGWITSFWQTDSFTGPARNAPNNGIDIKKIFDQRPTQVMTLSQSEVQEELKKLRPTKINAVPPLSHKPPIMKEFDDVFKDGYKAFFEARRKKQSGVEIVDTVIITVVQSVEITDSSNGNIDSSNGNIDSSNITVDSSNGNVDSSNITVDSSNGNIDSSNITVDSSNITVDSSNITVDSSNVNVDSSDVNVDSSDVNVDSSNSDLVNSEENTQDESTD